MRIDGCPLAKREEAVHHAVRRTEKTDLSCHVDPGNHCTAHGSEKCKMQFNALGVSVVSGVCVCVRVC